MVSAAPRREMPVHRARLSAVCPSVAAHPAVAATPHALFPPPRPTPPPGAMFERGYGER